MIRHLFTVLIAAPLIAALERLAPLDIGPDTELDDEPCRAELIAMWEHNRLINKAARELLADWTDADAEQWARMGAEA